MPGITALGSLVLSTLPGISSTRFHQTSLLHHHPPRNNWRRQRLKPGVNVTYTYIFWAFESFFPLGICIAALKQGKVLNKNYTAFHATYQATISEHKGLGACSPNEVLASVTQVSVNLFRRERVRPLGSQSQYISRAAHTAASIKRPSTKTAH